MRAIQRVSCPVNDSNTYVWPGFTAWWARRGMVEFWGFLDTTLLDGGRETNNGPWDTTGSPVSIIFSFVSGFDSCYPSALTSTAVRMDRGPQPSFVICICSAGRETRLAFPLPVHDSSVPASSYLPLFLYVRCPWHAPSRGSYSSYMYHVLIP